MQSSAPPPPVAMAIPAPTAPNGMTPPIGLAQSPVLMALDSSPGASAMPAPPAPASAPPSTENPVAYTQWLLSIIKSASSAPHDSGSPAPPAANSAAPPHAPIAMSRPAHPLPASSLESDASHHPPSLLDSYRPPSAAGIHPLPGTPSVPSTSSYLPPPAIPAHVSSSPARPTSVATVAPPPPITEAQVLLLVTQAVRPLQEMQSMLVQSSHAASARLDLLDAEIRSVCTDISRIPASSSSAATDAAVRLLRDEVTAFQEVLANERADHAVLKHEIAEERAELARTLQAVKAELDELVALKEVLRAERVALADLRERLEVEKTVAKVWSLIEDVLPVESESQSEPRMGAVATPVTTQAAPVLPRALPSEPGSPPVQIIEPPAAPPPPPPLIAVGPDPMLVDTPVPPAGFNAHMWSPTVPRHPNETTLAPAMEVGLPPPPPVNPTAPPELAAAPAAPPPRDDVPANPKRDYHQQQQRGDGQKPRRGRGASNGTNSNRTNNTNNQRKQNQARSKDRTSGGDAGGDGSKKPLIDRYIPPTSSRARAQRDLAPPPRRGSHDTDLRDQLSMPRRDRDHRDRDHRDREHPWRRAAIDTSTPPKRRRSLSPLPRPPPGPPPPHPYRDGGGPEQDHAPQFGPDDIPDDAAYLVNYARGGRRGSVVHINPNHHAYRGNTADPYAAAAGYTDASAAGYYASPQPQPPGPPSGAPTGQYEYYQGYYDGGTGFPSVHPHPHLHPHLPPPHAPPEDLSALLDDDGGMEPPTAAMDVARLSEMLRAVQAASAGLQGGGSAEGL
ncbi:hypothetical protein AMAG_02669 [Allomyces macrogynus ATCC 38327]|uniref:Uncharacterized protein n=1 Tax=Allomyces macrogynus (strain ATCC 38327) TaxID=578462 RepID=A0A0L0S2Z0_ALLM3|nr:hypothetical protein AMAG_02669 [Allomyces macrogynus ATCC 38327]|eukprot:KNE56898.1 hypothetical protein AMAG_02669 [Allomyces macrogynus ATCC 38327]